MLLIIRLTFTDPRPQLPTKSADWCAHLIKRRVTVKKVKVRVSEGKYEHR